MIILPKKLTDLNQWNVWLSRDGKKIPHDPTTLLAANQEDACTSFEFARDTLLMGRSLPDRLPFSGFGFRLNYSPAAPIASVDLDDCRNCLTGDIEPAARAIIDRLDSFAEISYSGTGIHIFVVTTQPPSGGCRTGRFEVYWQRRFIAVTGEHLDGTRTDLQDRTRELLDLHAELFPAPPPRVLAQTTAQASPLSDEELLRLASTAANGYRFRQLYFGPTPSGDPSRLDFEMCGKLMFWAGSTDFDRIDRLFRRSALMRGKWLRADYRIRTMRAAAARSTEQYTPCAGEVHAGR